MYLPRTWPLLITTERDVGIFVIGLLAIDFTITFVDPPETGCRTTIEFFCVPSTTSCVLLIFETPFEGSVFKATFRSNRLDVEVVTIRSPEGDSISFCPGCSPVTLVIFPSGPRIIPSF